MPAPVREDVCCFEGLRRRLYQAVQPVEQGANAMQCDCCLAREGWSSNTQF